MYLASRGRNSRRRSIFWLIIITLLAVAVVAAVFNRAVIYDFIRGVSYQPTEEVVGMREKLKLTDWGEFVFNASRPELNSRNDFNANCYSIDSEIAVLGCYTNMNIYVYNITEESLDGIRELTIAHELLHAVYARLSQEEKADLRPMLEKVYNDNLDILKDDLDTYVEGEKLEEIYVRAGTEIKKLPSALEEHYAKVFEDQDLVVSFYNKYIRVFREIEAKLDVLEAEMDNIGSVMDEKTKNYEDRVAELSARIEEFNNCADTAGCFNSSWEFYSQRNQLIMEQEQLDVLYDEINSLIDQYNEKVDEYNDNVLQNNKLNQIINSNQRVESIE